MSVLPDPARSQALLVGAHAYTHLEDLPAVANNLAGLQGVLTDPAVWGLPPEHCRVLSQPGSSSEILDAVQEAAGQAPDTLLVYYAGHGDTDRHSEELYLAVPDSKHDRVDTWLRYEYLRRAVLESSPGAQRTVLILDCCYSGRALVGRMGAQAQLADHAMVAGTCVLTASAETREAVAPPGEKYTAFSGELIAALSEGIPGAPDPIDMDSLYGHLQRALRAKSRPLPQQRNRNTGGQVALARNRAAASSASTSASAPASAPAPTPVPEPASPPPPAPSPVSADRPPAEAPRPRRDVRKPSRVLAAVALSVVCSTVVSVGGWYLLDGMRDRAPEHRAGARDSFSPRPSPSTEQPKPSKSSPSPSTSESKSSTATAGPSDEDEAPKKPPARSPVDTNWEDQLTCDNASVSYDDPGSGRLTRSGNMREGPASGCDLGEQVDGGTLVYYWCYVTNRYGYRWTYVRVAGGTAQGWISGDVLDDGGGTRKCPKPPFTDAG